MADRPAASDASAASEPATGRWADQVLDLIAHIPRSRRVASSAPARAARDAANAAAARAALAAGSLALPPGPLGWLTIGPELMTVWRIQSRLVADIAALYGRSAALGREQMLYCLFRHAASQAVRDLLVRAGERWVTRKLGAAAMRAIARRIGRRWTERTVGRGVSRWWPVVGAVGVGAYAYVDTLQVAHTAIEVFEREVQPALESGDTAADASPAPAVPQGS